MAKFKGIRKRWMTNTIAAVLLIVSFSVAAFSFAMVNFYYSSMSTGLEGRANAAAGFFRDTSESEFMAAATSYVETFEENGQLELQVLNTYGRIYLSSYGLTYGSTPNTPEIAQAISTGRPRTWSGEDPATGEHIMTASAPIVYNGAVVAVVRFVTSLQAVDQQMFMIITVAILVGVAILAMVYFSNLYFVKSIVEPLAAITETAKRIAAGSYGIQMEKKFDDEIGDLTDAINEM